MPSGQSSALSSWITTQRKLAAFGIVAATLALAVLIAWLLSTPVLNTPVQTLAVPQQHDAVRFGEMLVLDNGRALVGLQVEDRPFQAFMFDIATGTVLQTIVEPGSGEYALYLDRLIALDGDRVVMAAPDFHGESQLYVFDAKTGALSQTIDATGVMPFGPTALSMDGDLLAVGDGFRSYTENPGPPLPSRVLLFNVGTGELLREVVDPDATENSGFGLDLVLRGDRLLVGAPPFIFEPGVGRAYLFNTHDGSLLQSFAPPETRDPDTFGTAVDFVGDNVAICDTYVAHLFDASSGGVLQTYDDPTDGSTWWRFCGDLVADGGRVLVSARGQVYMYDAADGTLLATYIHPDSDDEPRRTFGMSIEMNGGHLLIGHGRTVAPVYVFTVEPPA